MPMKFNTEEEKRSWAQKMKEARLKKKEEKLKQEPKENLVSKGRITRPGYVWLQNEKGEKILLPEWLSNDWIKKGYSLLE